MLLRHWMCIGLGCLELNLFHKQERQVFKMASITLMDIVFILNDAMNEQCSVIRKQKLFAKISDQHFLITLFFWEPTYVGEPSLFSDL